MRPSLFEAWVIFAGLAVLVAAQIYFEAHYS